ncbi:MAG: RagB/SusD family nutrient uptake outer membrane protein [Prevotellaceae bacterium]|jgi:hypothetical protein|nr:RagB/SusD family nutrient uptake outer membrane protein [Prevotellaceae bacterium]
MKAKTIITICAGVITLFTACDDSLNIPQHGVLNYETYYQTDEQAETASTALYIQLRGLEYNYMVGKNMLGDDFWAGGAQRNDNAELEQLNEFTFGTEQSMLQGMFTSYYQIIYKANVALGHVVGDSKVMQRVRAEARVFRAWSYFELISMWGNPPLVDHELTPSEYSLPNGTTEELWALVETDLTEAINSGSLPEKANADDQSVWRVTKQFAQAVLGKAYLWQKKYSEAATVLDAVISSGKYRLYDGNYEDIQMYDHKMNCESILETIKVDDANNIWTNMNMATLMEHWRTDHMNIPAEYAANGYGFLNPQKSLYDDFVSEEGESGYRLGQTMKTLQQMGDLGISIKVGQTLYGHEGYFMWKWRKLAAQIPAAGYGFCDNNNTRWMRYAEVLLLAAEAHLEAGNTAKAAEYLNAVRVRAQLPPKTSITLNDIIIEKRLELCGEAVRFQDMTRWGIAATRMATQGQRCPSIDSNGNITYTVYNQSADGYGFKTGKHELLPYPGTEIRLNPNITQNPGW